MRFEHVFVDEEKPRTGTDIVCADVDGDGLEDILCGAWWYAAPRWERREIPGVYQVHCAFDVDGDGRKEIIATRRAPVPQEKNWYFGLSSDFVWLKPVDPRAGRWEEHPIGRGAGTWPHGIAMGKLVPGDRNTLVVAYHSAKKEGHFPELFSVPEDPASGPWPHRPLASIPHGEDISLCDLDGDGNLDIVLGDHWLENRGDGSFVPHRLAQGLEVSRTACADLNGDGRPDVVFCEETVDWAGKRVPYSRLGWLENPAAPAAGEWKLHAVDSLRCGHSLAVADLDGDGREEIVCAEHLPFTPYAGDGRLMVYGKRGSAEDAWEKTVVSQGFEHHDGTRIIGLAGGGKGIVSHGWTEAKYVHLWKVVS